MRKSLLAFSLSVAIVAVTLVVGAQAQTVSFSGASRTIATLSPGCCTPYEVAVDGSGDVFFAYGTEVEEILAVNGVVPASPTIKTVGSGFGVLWGLAVDKSGNVFVTDYEDSQTATTSGVKEITAASGYTSVVLLGGGYSFTFATAITVDGNGNVFVLDGEGNPAVREILAAGGYSTVTTLLASSEISHEPGTIAVDASGNIYVIAAAGNDGVEEIHAVDGSIPASPTVTMFGSGIIDATSVAVDWNGNLYISDSVELSGVYENAVQEFLAADNYSTVKTVGSGNSFSDGFSGALFGIAVDASGDIFGTGFYFDAVSELSASGGTFSSTNVGSTSSSPTTLAFTFSSSAEVGSIAILTEGATGLDFTNAGTGTCTVGTTYAAGANCGVDVSFSPKSVGPRYGAVELMDQTGNILATGLVSGTGVAPEIGFKYTNATVVPSLAGNTGNNATGNLVMDSLGDLFFTNSIDASPNQGDGSVVELPVSGYGFGSPVNFATGLPNPQGIAIDGAGNFFVLSNSDGSYDANTGGITEYLKTASGYAAPVTLATGLSYPNGLGIDGSGNLFFATNYDAGNDPNSGTVQELPLTPVGYGSPTLVAGGLSYPADLAVDGSGNIFVSLSGDYDGSSNVSGIPGTGSVVELTKVGAGFAAPVTIAGGFTNTFGVRVEPSGSLLVCSIANSTSENNTGTLFEIPQTSSGYGTPIALLAGASLSASAVTDGDGDILLLSLADVLYELPRGDDPALAFANTPVGQTSSPQVLTLENLGNAPLTFPVPASGYNPSPHYS